MELKSRIDALTYLGQQLKLGSEAQQGLIEYSYAKNKWFTPANIKLAMDGICNEFLEESKLANWVLNYKIPELAQPKSIGLVLAGNIPMVGFHDLLCVFLSGHSCKIKLSEKDSHLLPFAIDVMAKKYPEVSSYFEFVDRLKNFDAVIATGSNNSARYFETYFGKYPHIIRKNRNGIAVLTGSETREQLLALGDDVFQFFGLGCRNVSKLYVPENYNFDPLLEALHEFREIVNHNKYKNNFDYNYTLFILNKVEYKANGCILMKEEKTIASRIASLNFEYYSDLKALEAELDSKIEAIQCAVSSLDLKNIPVFPFGAAQKPSLSDFADGVDTMQFLLDL